MRPNFLSVTSGYYTPESMKKSISGSFAENNDLKITVDLNISLGNIVINNPKKSISYKSIRKSENVI